MQFGDSSLGVLLCQHISCRQPARFANIELSRPIPGADEFVFRQAVLIYLLLEGAGNPGVVRVEIQQSRLILEVLLEYLFTTLGGGFWPLPGSAVIVAVQVEFIVRKL